MIYLGIDPGATGAVGVLTAIDEPACLLAEVFDCPIVLGGKSGKQKQLDVASMAGELRHLASGATTGTGIDIRAAIEFQQAFPKQGASSTFKLGTNYGAWQGILATLGIPFELVRSQVWKPSVGLARGASKAESRAAARRLFPQVADQLSRVKDDGRAEALLIAEFRRRIG